MLELFKKGVKMAKVLIVRLTSLGDVIFTIPLACSLSENDNQVGWLVAEKGLEVVKNNPCVHKYHFVPLQRWKKNPFSLKTFKEFLSLIKELRKENYDIAIDCQQMFKSLLLFAFCGARRRISVRGAREFSFLGANEFVEPKASFRDFNYHIVERNLDFARYLGICPEKIKFALPETSQETKNKINDLLNDIQDEKPIMVISPATTWQNKHWAERNWAEVVDAFSERCNVLFTGTKSDKELIANILKETSSNPTYIDLTGKTNVEELREVFSRAKIVIAPDSGSAHLAWATSIPAVIAVFTSTPPKRFGPYGEDKYFSVSSDMQCQPCFKKKCKNLSDFEICRKAPDAEEIINIVNSLL